MPKVINSITPEQEAMFPEWLDKWTKICLSTDRMDFERAKTAVEKLYSVVDSPQPKLILRADSPLAACKLAVYETQRLNGDKSFKMEDITRKQIIEASQNFYGGCMYSAWGSFITFFRDVMEWENDTLSDFHWAEELMHTCGWVWWSDDIAIIVDRPVAIFFDENMQLHGEDKPAIEYIDGYSVYCWHGTRVPKEWIADKENMDPTIALKWDNIEQRRCAAEILGWVKVLDQLDAKVIDQAMMVDEVTGEKVPDYEIGTLVEVDIPDIGKERFLKVRCATGRDFALPVDPSNKTALEAQASTWGMSPDEFLKPEVRT